MYIQRFKYFKINRLLWKKSQAKPNKAKPNKAQALKSPSQAKPSKAKQSQTHKPIKSKRRIKQKKWNFKQ
jgi:hypothetical protein